MFCPFFDAKAYVSNSYLFRPDEFFVVEELLLLTSLIIV